VNVDFWAVAFNMEDCGTSHLILDMKYLSV
jgi:hypothetical protein